jgi:hypothetical protein
LACGLALAGCGLVDYQREADKPEAAVGASVQMDIQNMATQVMTWYATEQANPSLVVNGSTGYLCAPENVNNPDACTPTGPISAGSTLRVVASGPASFCVEGTMAETGETWHQNASGGIKDGSC